MGIRERKPAAASTRPRQQPRPVDKAIAAEIRRRAEKLAAAVEIPGKNGAQGHNHQRQQTEQQMAKLRGEAVQARRLAEHIENLSQEAATIRHKRKKAMTDSTIANPGHAKRRQRRTDDKPASSGNRLNFNPLHPSMELPPEQLIRLLGMESKKIRKSRKARQTPKQVTAKKPRPETENKNVARDRTPPPVKPRPQATGSVDRSIQYERCEAPQVFDNGHSGLLVPSLVVGVVAGIIVSGYLFWSQPANSVAQKTPSPATAKQAQTTQSRPQLVKRTAPTAASAPKQKMSAQENAAWRATINAEEQRLRTAAEQRLSDRISQVQQTPQPAALPAVPVSDASPVPAFEPATAPGLIDEAELPLDIPVENSLPKPVPAAIELQDAQEVSPALESFQPDEGVLSSTTPEESTTVLPAAVEMEPQTGDENATIDEMPGVETTPAAPAISDVETEAYPLTAADPVPGSVGPADDEPTLKDW